MGAHTVRRLALEDMEPALAERLRPKIQDAGFLPELFQVAALQPRATVAFLDIVDALADQVPLPLKQVVGLTAAAVAGNDYELVQHQRMCLAAGRDPQWVAQVSRAGSGDEDGSAANGGTDLLTEDELAIQRLVVVAVSRQAQDAEREMADVVARIGEQAAVAVLMMTGFFLAGSLVANANAVAPPFASPLHG